MLFIEFNNKKIEYTTKNGTFWLNVADVCAVFNVDLKSLIKINKKK